MKILYLTKYTSKAGSSRMRSFQYFPYFKEQGFKIVAKPFFSEKYINDFYAGKKNIPEILKAYIRRFFVMFSVFSYDKIVVEKEIFPYLPAFTERILNVFGIKYISDYDDAIFHNYDQSTNPYFKFFLKKKIDKVMKYSSLVIAGNSYLAERAKKAGAKNIEIIPTVIDLERYSVKKVSRSEKDKFIVGWVGTKTTFEKHLLPCKNWIIKLQDQEPNIEFHIVGISEDQNLGQNVKWIPWKAETENEEINKFDIGIMPLKDSLWEKGKCAYKLIQYAACGIPGIASDVGMNSEVTVENKTGFLVNSNEEWIEKILFLSTHPEIRKNMGTEARHLVEEKYSIQVTAKKWIQLLNGFYGK